MAENISVNLYICSTVKHALFALMRANHHLEEKHLILYFYDFQDAHLSLEETRNQAEHCQVVQLEHIALKNQLQATVLGRAIYFCAMRNLPIGSSVRKKLIDIITQVTPELKAAELLSNSHRLWLFNQRNRMSRLFRLLSRTFHIIEDGESNYFPKIVPAWKRPARLLLGLPVKHRYYGEDKRCKEIWVQDMGRLPEYIRDKGRRIDFIDTTAARTAAAILFGSQAALDDNQPIAILATQRLEVYKGASLDGKLALYRMTVRHLQNAGYKVYLKPHPAEDQSEYNSFSEDSSILDNNVPLEVYLCNMTQPALLVSMFSAAGLGFENICRRLPLIEKNHLEEYICWINQPDLLEAVLTEKIPCPGS
jgi:hypothetical protein